MRKLSCLSSLLGAALVLLACGDDTGSGAAGGGGAGGDLAGSSNATTSGSSVSSSTSSSSSTADTGATTSGAGGGGGDGGGAGAIEWSPCPLYVDQPDGTQAECARVDVPLRWSDPGGPTIDVFVQRLAGTSAEPHKQLWLLEGGPGGSGADFDGWMEQMRELDPSLDLYAVDHRGVGRSARLTCPEQESPDSEWGISVSSAEAAACHDALVATWGDDLAEFGTTAAARDLGRLIERASVPGQDVFVYGVSYGTYWAHRYLQVHPTQATGVVLDSIAPSTQSFVGFDADYDAVARDLMDRCAGDALCTSKLGADPWAALEALHATLDDGHCAELTATWGLDAIASRSVLAALLTSPLTRTYVPALVYRHARCAPDDVAAIDRLLTVFFAGQGEDSYYDTLSSDGLFYNVALSELWPNPADHPTLEEIAAIDETLHVTTELTARIAEMQDAWVPYADDEYVRAWATTSTPLLMMNGDLDPQTPVWVASEVAPHLAGPHQTFLTVPRAAHCVTLQTPAEEGARSCGLQLLLDFLGDPLRDPDTTCFADIPEERFTGDPAWNEYLLGTPDLWENGPRPIAAPAPLSVARERQLVEVRRRIRELLAR